MRLTMLSALAIIILMFAACTLPSGTPPTTPSGTLVTGDCNVFESQPHTSKDIEVNAGDSFAVILCSNTTTGFSWSESAQISDPTIVRQLDHKTLPPKNTSLVGAPGYEIWTFEALKKGTSTIHNEYSRPWEGGEKGVWTIDLSVTVK